MIKLGTNSIGKIYLGSNPIGKAYLGSNLVFQNGGGPSPVLPYTPVSYIETDGSAYINTGVNGNDPRSCEIKVLIGATGAGQCILGTETGAEDTSLYNLAYIGASGNLGLGHRYFYNNPDFPITAQTVFELKCAMKNASQVLQLKLSGESSFTSYSKTQSSTITTGRPMYLFAGNNSNSSIVHPCSSGSRVYYCKIYTDFSYSTLAFDGVPCYYNGAYGLWDKVSDSFFGNAGTGAFTGPSIS